MITDTPNYTMWQYPNVWSGTGIQVSPTDVFPFQIRQVENGFILKVGGREYVFNKVQDLLAELTEHLTT
jgi:hypothetical protein